MKILIADDDAVSRKLLEVTLRRLGHDVTALADGQAARDALLAPGGPRLAVLDWMMPGLDGLAVCRAVRQHNAPYVYIILLTSKARHEDMVTGLAAQADDFLTKPFNLNELQARIQSGARILELQSSLLDTQAALQHEATHDRLTGLWNRGMVLDYLSREFARAERRRDPLTIALVDVDHFKAINDTYGHDAGDQVLRETATRMQEALRKADVVGRYGGEEFLLVLSEVDAAGAAKVLERVRHSVSGVAIDTSRGPVAITVSIGYVGAIPDADQASALIAKADEALYYAKDTGRDCVVNYASIVPSMMTTASPAMDARTSFPLTIATVSSSRLGRPIS